MYCINALTKWCDNWERKAQRNGEDVWRNQKGKPIVHQKIFERIQFLERIQLRVNYTAIYPKI